MDVTDNGRRSVAHLAGLAREGDAGALSELLRRIQPEVLRRCARFLPHRQDAEEACRCALARVAREITHCDTGSPFTTWLSTVVSSTARQTYRSMKHRCVERPMDPGVAPPRDPRTTSVVAGSRIHLLEALDELERQHPNLVAPLVLRDLCQMEYRAIARELGLELGTVKSRIQEGRTRVRRSLAAARA